MNIESVDPARESAINASYHSLLKSGFPSYQAARIACNLHGVEVL